MDATIVYKVAKALSLKEQELLFSLLKNDFTTLYSTTKNNRKKAAVLTDQEAINYLFKNVFKCNQ